jgi:hypothetical protein
MNELTSESLEVIRVARFADDPSPSEVARALDRFTKEPCHEARGLQRRARVVPFAKVWAAPVLLAAGALAAAHQRFSGDAEAAIVAPRPVPAVTAPRAPVAHAPRTAPRVAPAASIELEPRALAVPAPRKEPKAGAGSMLPASRKQPKGEAASAAPVFAHELGLIIAARDALARREFETARARASQHAREFPNGPLSEERAAILALAECRRDGAIQAAQLFAVTFPRSVFFARVVAECKLEPIVVPGEEPGDTQ